MLRKKNPIRIEGKQRARKGKWWRLSIVLLILLCLAGVGALYQSIAGQNDTRTYAAPGKLIDVGGYRLHLYCTGIERSGTPTVVLEAGFGGSVLDWSKVQPVLSRSTRVCSYDRAGFGWSDSTGLPHTSQHIATALHTLLHKAAITGPYILVGHSFGGVYARYYAYTYPREVVGLIMVDSFQEDQYEVSSDALTGVRLNLALLPVAHLGALVGMTRLLANANISPFDSALYPPSSQPQEKALLSQTRYASSVRAEFAGAEESCKQLRAIRHSFGRLPLVVLTRGMAVDDGWNRLQQRLVQLSTASSQTIVKKSDHYIQLEAPTFVIEAIQYVLAQTQR